MTPLTAGDLRDWGMRLLAAGLVLWAVSTLLFYYFYGFGRAGQAAMLGRISVNGIAFACAVFVGLAAGWRDAIYRALCTVGAMVVAAPILMMPLLIHLIWQGEAEGTHAVAYGVGQMVAFVFGMAQVVVFSGVLGTFVIAIGVWVGRDPV